MPTYMPTHIYIYIHIHICRGERQTGCTEPRRCCLTFSVNRQDPENNPMISRRFGMEEIFNLWGASWDVSGAFESGLGASWDIPKPSLVGPALWGAAMPPSQLHHNSCRAKSPCILYKIFFAMSTAIAFELGSSGAAKHAGQSFQFASLCRCQLC